MPELASRDHVRKTLPLVRQVLDEAGIGQPAIDGVAYTAGPGLIGALMVGAALGRSLAWAWGVPAVGVHHMEGHLLAPMLEPEPPEFPFVALLVSGGHTQLVAGRGHRPLPDAGRVAGRCRRARPSTRPPSCSGCPTPAGPALAGLAERGNPGRFRFPRPMTDRPGLDFSFSGLKTFALNTLREGCRPAAPDAEQTRADIARAFEEAVVDTLVIKCRRAVRRAAAHPGAGRWGQRQPAAARSHGRGHGQERGCGRSIRVPSSVRTTAP